MRELFDLSIHIISGLWHYRWKALITSWVIFLVGWFAISSIPDSYQANAKVHVDSVTVLQPLLRGLAIQQDITDQVQMMTRVLLSRPTLKEVIHTVDMDLKVENDVQMESLLKKLETNITVTSGRGRRNQNLFEISYTDSDAKQAQNVVQALLNVFMEASIGYEREEALTAQRFLGEQVKEYEAKLVEAENRLADFKKQNVGLMPDNGLDYYGRLQQALSERERTSVALQLATRKSNELRRQIGGEEPVFGFATQSFQNPQIGPYAEKIAVYEQQLNDLLIRYTEQHPEVIGIRETIAELEAEQLEEQKLLGSSAGYSAADPLQANPVYQSMKVALSTAEVEVAGLREQYRQQTNIIERLKQSVNKVPEIEAELTKLTRDYQINKTKYESLFERFESAKLSEEVGKSSDNVSFRIIEPPKTSYWPVWPNRKLMFSMLAVVSLLLGLGAAFMYFQVRPVFLSPKYLHHISNVPVWGCVTAKLSPLEAAKSKLNLGIFFSVCSVLVVCFTLSYLFSDAGVAILSNMKNLVGV